jgi:hypothetical protein
MMLVSAAQIAASAVILTLAGSCGRNMLQTALLVRSISDSSNTENLLPESACTNPPDTIKHLESLNRKELVELYCLSRAPSDLSEIEGEWNARLLENNGIVMTTVSNVMTNGLFALGMGRRWSGKSFASGGKGINRFINKKDGSADTEHSFDFSIQESGLQSGKQAVRLRYSEYQSPLSLWKTMVDEVRFLPGDTEVMIGLGAMAWSGGMLNSSPFILWRANPIEKAKNE